MANFSLTWLPAVLRAAGLTVVEQPDWKTRGHGDMGKILGVLCHHTAGAKKGNAPSLAIVTKGRPDLAGPLAQLVLGRDGTFYVVAAGRCYHAGAGEWRGVKNGNTNLIGIEAENTGLGNDNPWPSAQMKAYVRGVAAILKHAGAPAVMAVGHLEYALPVGRKSDPSFSVGDRAARIKAMAKFRADVSAVMSTALEPIRFLDAPAAEGPGDADDAIDADDTGAADDAPDEALDQQPQPRPIEAPLAEAPAPPVADVASVQRRLRELGYFAVGIADGDMAGQTRGAIVAFKHDNAIVPETPDIDQAFLAALAIGKPRQVSEARANTTESTLGKKNETIWAMAWDKLVKLATAIGAGVMALISYAGEKLRDTWEWLGTFRDQLSGVPLWFWLGAAAAIVLVSYELSRRASKDTLGKYKTGELLS